MIAHPAFKHLGLLAALVLFCGLGYVARTWPQGLHRTFSQHIATSRRAIVFYVALFVAVLPLLLLSFLGWFGPTFHLSAWFSGLIIAASATQFLCTVIPETTGWKRETHRALAFLSASCLLPIMAIILIDGVAVGCVELLGFISLAFMVATMAILGYHKAEHKFLLLFQAGYFAAFFATVLAVTYLS